MHESNAVDVPRDESAARTRSPGRPRVVIVGGGFGGLWAARALAGAEVDVTLLDRRNHHVFQPLLYQVATAGLSPGEIASPIRWILRRQANVTVLLGDVLAINCDAKRLRLSEGAEPGYDYLIVAAGARHAYFGHDDWRAHAPGLKTMEDALHIRRRVLLAFEQAERLAGAPDGGDPEGLLTFVIVGGGPTGVELAGALAEIARHTMRHDFRRIDPSKAAIILVEGGPRVLPAFSEPHSAFARGALERLGVSVRTSTMVTAVDGAGVTVRAADGSESRIASRTALWAAGVAASPLGAGLSAHTDRAGRVRVRPELTISERDDVFVVGDLATLAGPDGQPYPGVAQVAMQQGAQAARNVLRRLAGQPMRPFRYRDYGNMATIGRAKAVADLGWLQLRGYVAWLAWLFIHVLKLIGFRNRASVMLQWAWAYFSYQRSARLITDDEESR
ncbi:MAG TPA: NAD(P)/FAD-dependent oxidoreductase [Vicinamibacterales bacterium]|nr:NAD(P)/FAD-dependent oxidoreductase [Vicinamibacterales bacterium]